jgi:CRP-like cAMP-binding protein
MEERWLKVLSKSLLVHGIDDAELAAMWECLQPRVRNYLKGDFIAVAGDRLTGVGILLEGKAVVLKENTLGERIIMTQLEPGDMMGEMAAFSEMGVWPATVMAQERSTAVFLPPEKIVGDCPKLCAGHKRLIVNMLRIVTERALMLNRKLEYFAIKSMRGKIGHFLLEQYQRTGKLTFTIPMKRNELADFLNVSRPSLSREMGRMRDEGLIEFYQASIRIKDLEALKRSVQA